MSLAATALAALTTGFLLRTAAQLTFPWYLLFWVALVPWLASIERARSARDALVAGVLGALAFNLLVFDWFALAVAHYAALSPALCWLALGIASPLMQPQMLTVALGRWVARQVVAPTGRRFAAALTAALVWVATEWAFGKLLGDTLGLGLLHADRLRQAADLSGAPGLTVALVLGNEAVLSMFDGARRGLHGVPARRTAAAGLAGLLGLVAALEIYGAVRLREVGEATPSRPLLTVGIVQANLANYAALAAERGTFGAAEHILDESFALSREALARAPVDLVVWPETVYPTTFAAPKSEAGGELDDRIRAFVAKERVPLLFGTYELAEGREYNAAALLAPGGTGRSGLSLEFYRKAHLFPLTERVPAWLDFPVVRRAFPWLGTWQAGENVGLLSVGLRDGRRIHAGPAICYDSVDAHHSIAGVRAGADVLVALSNDSWFDDGRGADLHLAVAAFRSIETRRPQIRSTNTGISAVIDASGAITTSLPARERGVIVAAVPAAPDLGAVPGASPLAIRYGEAVGRLAALLSAMAAAAALWRRPRA